jgi:alkylation response protein AidB-like acyl-CoA dehydrogenase
MTAMLTAADAEGTQWVQRAQALASLTEEWRNAGERERHLSPTLFEKIRQADIFRMSTPKSVGGLELGEEAAVRIVEELSRQDGAVGWNVMVASNTATIASYLPVSGLRTVFERPDNVIAGALLPKGMATPVPGGYRLSGRWTMASGCHQATWMVAASTVMEGGAPRCRADGRPDLRTFFVPVAECKILDTWHSAGLRGTGSHDWEVHDVLVPEQLSFSVLIDGQGEPGALFVHDFAAYAVARVAAVALGIARDAIDSFITMATKKVPTAGSTPLGAQHTTHEHLGRAEALLRGARAYLYETIRALPYSPSWSLPLTEELRAAIRLAAAHAAQSAVEAVDEVFRMAGTSGVYANSRLERCFRDVHVAAQHINVAPSNIEMVGQHLLGFGLHLRR